MITLFLRYIFVFSLCCLFFLSCKTKQQSVNRAGNLAFSLIIPDSCDVYLIESIKKYRIENYKYPDKPYIQNEIDKSCSKNFNSIEVLAYKNDSMDLALQKVLNDSISEFKTMMKYYRLVYISDSLTEVRLLNNNKKYSSALINNH
jgi:hypothetical protein